MRTEMTNRTNDTLLKVATLIAIIGALNWGLIGVFNWNLVDAIFGGGSAETTSAASRVVYTLVGLAGLIALFVLGPRHTPADTHHAGAAR